MATRRTQIEIVVLNLSDLTAMNTALGVHDKRLQGLTATYLVFNAAVNAANPGLQKLGVTTNNITNNFDNANRSITNITNNVTNMGRVAGGANNQFGGFLGTMLQYRAVSLVFEGVTKAIGATVQAMADMEKQAARVQRVSAPGSTPGIRADIAVEASRTGADIKDIGEAYYQLKTQIGDNTAAFAALQTAMNLVVGTESDARDTTRAMLQVYNQFGDQLGQNVGQSERMRRAGELLAVMWKGSAAEVSELTSALKYLGPAAQAAHVPLEQTAALVTTLTYFGVRGRMAGTEGSQALSQMIQHFDLATGMIKNKGATLQAGLTPSGGLDPLQTLKNFVEVANSMPVEKAMKFSQAISGSQNAWRLFGATNPEFLRMFAENIDKAAQATHGLTAETNKLKDAMMTTEQEGKRAFGGMFAYIASMVDRSPVRRWLHDIADDFEALLDAGRRQQQLSDRLHGVYAPGAPVRPAVSMLRAAVSQVLENIQADPAADLRMTAGVPGMPPPRFTHTLPQYFRTGVTPADEEMFRGRYLSGGPQTWDQLKAALQRDYATTTAQLRDPNFGRPGRDAGSARFPGMTGSDFGGGSGGGDYGSNANIPGAGGIFTLRNLSPSQMRNAAIIAQEARKAGMNPNQILPLIATAMSESNLSNYNRSSAGADGLFQFVPGTWNGAVHDPHANAAKALDFILHGEGTRRNRTGPNHGPMPPELTGMEAAQWIIESFERPGAAGARGDMGRVAQFYQKNVKASPLGGYDPKEDDKAAKAAAKAAEDAERERLEAAKTMAERAQILYEKAVKDYGPEDSRTVMAAKTADQLAKMAADDNEKLRLKYGLSGNVAANQKEIDAAREERKKEADEAKKEASKQHADALEYYAEEAQRKYGMHQPITRQRAQEAQDAAAAIALKSGDIVQYWKLKADQTGPNKQLSDAVQESHEKDLQEGDAKREKAAQDFLDAQRASLGKKTDALSARTEARQLGLRPNMLGGGADARQENVLFGNILDIAATIQDLKREIDVRPTEETAKLLADMQMKLAAANAALVDFHDTLDQKAYSKRVQAEQDAYELRNQEIDHLHKLRFNKDEDAAAKDAVQKYRELIVSAEQNIADVTALGGGQQSEDVKRKAQKDLDAARQNLTDYQIDAKMQKYQNAYSTAKGEVSSSLMTFFHGQGSIGDVFKGLGGTIVDASLQSWIKKYSDPLIQTVTSEILAIQGNTDALTLLTTTMSGGAAGGGLPGSAAGSGFGAVVAAGVAAGIAGSPWGNGTDANGSPVSTAGAGTKGGKGSQNQSDLQKGIGAGLAAYSIFSTGQQQGVNAGNLLGGILSGASIGASIGGPVGGAIGAAAGGLFDIIGGLFHQRSKPTATPQDLNPAYYNAPSNFDVAAYNYSAYGKLPTVANVGFAVKPANAPIVNVFVDGARVAARQEISNQTTLATISLANTTVDRHAPV